MYKFLIVSLVFSLSLNDCLADEGDNQANAFTRIYTSLCLKNLQKLEGLREKLKPIPTLPSEKAAFFLAGNEGNAWPVPNKNGTFVLALLNGKNFCALYARRANTETVKKLFTKIFTHPPAPITVKKLLDKQEKTASNGIAQTVSYEWSVQNATRKLLFTLTTASSESAQIQVMGSAAIISE